MLNDCAVTRIIWCKIIISKYGDVHIVVNEYFYFLKIFLSGNVHRFWTAIYIQIYWPIPQTISKTILTYYIHCVVLGNFICTNRNRKIVLLWTWIIVYLCFRNRMICRLVFKIAILYKAINWWLAKKWWVVKSYVCNFKIIWTQGITKIVTIIQRLLVICTI